VAVADAQHRLLLVDELQKQLKQANDSIAKLQSQPTDTETQQQQQQQGCAAAPAAGQRAS
jgi:TolA-binding protein